MFLNKEVATAALEDAKNFSIQNAELQNNGEQIELSFASLDCCEKPTAPTWADFDSLWSSMRREMEYEMKWLREDLSYYHKRFNDHMKGHLPPILDAGKMQGAIKALGMDDSYEVKKASVYVEYF